MDAPRRRNPVSDCPLTAALAESGANVLSLEHRRGHRGLWVTEAEIALAP